MADTTPAKPGARAAPVQATAPAAAPQRPSRPSRRPRPGATRCDRRARAGRRCAARAGSGARARRRSRRQPRLPPARCRGSPTTPLGIWATEENKGNVRIEQCGANLCGYAVKTDEKILINMKPQARKWTGRIHDPDSGRNYNSTIAMKGTERPARPGLRLRRHVLRRPDLEARELTISPDTCEGPCRDSPRGLRFYLRPSRLACRPELNLTVVQETCLGEEAQIQRIWQSDVFEIGAWFHQRIV